MKISIITINLNNSEGLEKTIQSVANQTYNEIEYLIIDGGSVDNSIEVAKKYEDKISYFVSEYDNGIYHAMNKGIKKSTGDYLLFLNSGDILLGDSVISSCVAYGFNEDLIIGDLVFFDDTQKKEWKPAYLLTFDLFCNGGIPHPSTFIHKNLFNKVGFYDEAFKIVSDWKFFMLAVCKFNCSYKRVDVFVTGFMDGGISTQKSNEPLIQKERKKAIKENFSAFLSDYEELWASRKQLRKLRYTIKIKNFFGIR